MKLLTKEIEQKIPKLYATEEQTNEEKIIICKFFNPMGRGTWYAIEGETREDGEFIFFGLVDLFEKELGYFSLKELEEISLPFGLKIERDLNFIPQPLSKIMGR